MYDDPFEELKVLRQSRSVNEYIEQFELVSSHVPRLTESQYVSLFMGELRTDIRQRVHTLRPTSQWIVMQLARDDELEIVSYFVFGNSPLRLGKTFRAHTFSNPFSKGLGSSPIGPISSPNKPGVSFPISALTLSSPMSRPSSSVASTTTPPPSAPFQHRRDNDKKPSTDRSRGFNHISYQELMDRKRKGLCFRCNERFHPLHQCPSKSLQLIIIGHGETMAENGELTTLAGDDGEEAAILDCNVMSLMSVYDAGHTDSNTMCIHGIIGDVPIMILVDNNASHNLPPLHSFPRLSSS